MSVAQVKQKPTYKQNWAAYNAAQTAEKAQFLALLFDLCGGVADPVQTFGRPRLSYGDMIFCAALKVYSGMSSRRCCSDLAWACEKGYIAKAPHFNSISNYLELEHLTPTLKMLIEQTALPLKAVEVDFAIDASGFSMSRFDKWFDEKYGAPKGNDSWRPWMKLHLMCGVKTNIVTSVEISEKNCHDNAYFAPLIEGTARNFQLREVSADKAYLSHPNLQLVDSKGAVPYIPFKSNTTGKSECEVWKRMYHLFKFNEMEWRSHYHKRSNVESTFSMIKAKFGDALRSKTETSQMNEMLLKVLCHNICCLILAMYELGIEPTFCAESQLAQKVTV